MSKDLPQTRDHPFFFLPAEDQDEIINKANPGGQKKAINDISNQLESEARALGVFGKGAEEMKWIIGSMPRMLRGVNALVLTQHKKGIVANIIDKLQDPSYAEKTTTESKSMLQRFSRANNAPTFKVPQEKKDDFLLDVQNQMNNYSGLEAFHNDEALAEWASRSQAFNEVWKGYRETAQNLKVEAYTKAKNAKEAEAEEAQSIIDLEAAQKEAEALATETQNKAAAPAAAPAPVVAAAAPVMSVAQKAETPLQFDVRAEGASPVSVAARPAMDGVSEAINALPKIPPVAEADGVFQEPIPAAVAAPPPPPRAIDNPTANAAAVSGAVKPPPPPPPRTAANAATRPAGMVDVLNAIKARSSENKSGYSQDNPPPPPAGPNPNAAAVSSASKRYGPNKPPPPPPRAAANQTADTAEVSSASTRPGTNNLPPPPSFPPPIPNKNDIEKRKKQDVAATKIQKVVRGEQTRASFYDALDDLGFDLKDGLFAQQLEDKQWSELNKAATKIQKVVRGKQARDGVQEYLDTLPAGLEDKVLADRAATERHKQNLLKAYDQFNMGSIGQVVDSRGVVLPSPPNRKPPVPDRKPPVPGGRTV